MKKSSFVPQETPSEKTKFVFARSYLQLEIAFAFRMEASVHIFQF